jgi:hypothetical protein
MSHDGMPTYTVRNYGDEPCVVYTGETYVRLEPGATTLVTLRIANALDDFAPAAVRLLDDGPAVYFDELEWTWAVTRPRYRRRMAVERTAA